MTDDARYDATDIRILDALQDDIPLVHRPFEAISRRLGIPMQELLDRLKRHEETGIVKGISPTLEPRPMGLTAATLVALRVPEQRVHEVAAIINRYPEVSHNFRRDHDYTIWFTISGNNGEDLQRVLTDILQCTGIPDSDVLNLPTVRKLKVDVRFSFTKDMGEEDIIGSR